MRRRLRVLQRPLPRPLQKVHRHHKNRTEEEVLPTNQESRGEIMSHSRRLITSQVSLGRLLFLSRPLQKCHHREEEEIHRKNREEAAIMNHPLQGPLANRTMATVHPQASQGIITLTLHNRPF